MTIKAGETLGGGGATRIGDQVEFKTKVFKGKKGYFMIEETFYINISSESHEVRNNVASYVVNFF